MVIQCPNCAARFKFDESKLSPKGAKFRCKSCQHVFVVTPPNASARNVAAPSLTPPRPVVSAPLPPQPPKAARPVPSPPPRSFASSSFPPPDEPHNPSSGPLGQTQLASSFSARPHLPTSNRSATFPAPQNSAAKATGKMPQPTGGFPTIRDMAKSGNSISSQWDAGDFLAAQTGRHPGTEANMAAAKVAPPMGNDQGMVGLPPMEDNPAETRSIDLEDLHAQEQAGIDPAVMGNSDNMLDLSGDEEPGALELETGPRPIPTTIEFQGLNDNTGIDPAKATGQAPVLDKPAGTVASPATPPTAAPAFAPKEQTKVAYAPAPSGDDSIRDQMTNGLDDVGPSSTDSLGDSLELDAPASKKKGSVSLPGNSAQGVSLDSNEDKPQAKGFRPRKLKGRKTTKVMKTEEIPQLFSRAVKLAFAAAALWVALIGATMARQGDEFDINVLTLGGMVNAWLSSGEASALDDE